MVYRKDWGQPQQGGQGFARTMKCYGRKANVTAADNVTGNVIGMFTIPNNFKVLGMFGTTTNMGAAMVFNLGDAGNSSRFGSAVAGSAAADLPAMPVAARFFTTTADSTDIQLTITTQSSAPVAGIVEMYLWGFIL